MSRPAVVVRPARRLSLRRQPAILALLACALIAVPRPAAAYLHLTVEVRSGDTVPLRWDRMPLPWFVTNRGVPGVSASQLQAAVERSFRAWESVPTAAVATQFGGFTAAEPFADDFNSVIGFFNEPDLDRTLGATSFLIDAITGEILEADVFFNSSFAWSVAAAGESQRFDLESVALHELGHVFGLGHSALGETDLLAEGRRRVVASGAVMFPIAFGPGNIADRRLQPDDIAGISDLYPAAGFRENTGVAQGRVRRAGRGVLGAHVVAFHLQSGTLVGAFALTEHGEFEIAGLQPGPHLIRVEPLDDADVDSFFTGVQVDTNFAITYYQRHFVAPAGGAGRRFDVTVRAR